MPPLSSIIQHAKEIGSKIDHKLESIAYKSVPTDFPKNGFTTGSRFEKSLDVETFGIYFNRMR